MGYATQPGAVETFIIKRIVALALQGHSVATIAAALGIHPNIVATILAQYGH